jgi:hypothetical protein
MLYNRRGKNDRKKEREREKETNPVETAVHFVHFFLSMNLMYISVETAVQYTLVSLGLTI